jgi:hypothetical protein
VSKESKPRDLWNHALGKRDLVGMCSGCGYYLAVHGVHRVDCTAEVAVAERERTGQGHCAGCRHTTPLAALKWVGCRWLCLECRQPARKAA